MPIQRRRVQSRAADEAREEEEQEKCRCKEEKNRTQIKFVY